MDRKRGLAMLCRCAIAAALVVIAMPASGAAGRQGPSLQESTAEATVRDAIERRLGGSSLIFNELDCSRLAPRAYSCRAAFFVADALWEGTGSVRLRRAQGDSRYAFRLNRARRLCKGVECRHVVRWCGADGC